jgi:hypothetical protein
VLDRHRLRLDAVPLADLPGVLDEAPLEHVAGHVGDQVGADPPLEQRHLLEVRHVAHACVDGDGAGGEHLVPALLRAAATALRALRVAQAELDRLREHQQLGRRPEVLRRRVELRLRHELQHEVEEVDQLGVRAGPPGAVVGVDAERVDEQLRVRRQHDVEPVVVLVRRHAEALGEAES